MPERSRTAIVTGGTGPLGRVLTRTLLENGYRVAVPFRDILKADRLRAAHPSDQRLLLFKADISREEPVSLFTNTVLEQFGSVEVLIHAAGGYFGGKLVDETEPADWDRVMENNLKSAFLMCRAVLPSMRISGFGRIISISARTALEPSARRAAYAVAKGGLVTLTEVIADEIRGSGITINTIAPSVIITEENRAADPEADISRWVPPEDITRLVLYFISDEAESVNGSTIRMFGGL